MTKIKNTYSWISKIFASEKKESWKVVLLCLIAATTFWFFNALNDRYTTRLNYPIQFEFDGSDVVVVEKLPSKIRLDVTGGGWNLLRKTLWFNINPLKVHIDQPAERKFIIGASLLPVISDQIDELTLNYIITDTLYLRIEKRVSKTVAVTIDSASIKLAPRHRISSSISVDPDSITFLGPSSFIDSINDSLKIDIPKEGINENYQATISVRPADSDLISVSPESVTVRFEVDPFEVYLLDVPIKKINFPADSSRIIREDKVSVSFYIQRGDLDKLKAEDFEVVANYRTMANADSTVVPVIKQTPDYVWNASVIEKKLKVRNGR